MGYPLTYTWTEKLFSARRKNKDFKAYKTDTHLTKEADGSFVFSYVQFNWVQDENTKEYKREDTRSRTPLVSIAPNNVMTLLAPETKNWPSVHHMTIRNRLHDITGFDIYSDTSHHKNKDMPIRITHRFYKEGVGWLKQEWCADSKDKTMPYKAGTQFQLTDTKSGKVECLNPPTDVKQIVKNESIQSAKADTAVIRKLAMAMLRMGYEEHIEKKLANYWYAPPQTKLLADIDYKNPTGDDATAVLNHGMRVSNKPDAHVWADGKYTERSMDERVRLMRERVIENGMKALRKHIYATTNGYEKVEVK
jgi:hypothetical protein